METYLICLAVAMVGGLMLSRVTKLLHLPAVTAYLVAGLLLQQLEINQGNNAIGRNYTTTTDANVSRETLP